MTSFATALNFTFVAILAVSALLPDAFAAKRKPETQAEIDCWNRAINDYWTEVNS